MLAEKKSFQKKEALMGRVTKVRHAQKPDFAQTLRGRKKPSRNPLIRGKRRDLKGSGSVRRKKKYPTEVSNCDSHQIRKKGLPFIICGSRKIKVPDREGGEFEDISAKKVTGRTASSSGRERGLCNCPFVKGSKNSYLEKKKGEGKRGQPHAKLLLDNNQKGVIVTGL